jgi:hypothetical protein
MLTATDADVRFFLASTTDHQRRINERRLVHSGESETVMLFQVV